MPLFITALKDGAKYRNKRCNVFRLFSKRMVQLATPSILRKYDEGLLQIKFSLLYKI